MAPVTLERVTKRYGEVVAVQNLSLRLPDGRFTVLVGPSGCGKTSTLRMVAGLETVSEGTIRIGDRDVTALEPKDRDVAMVFQNYALYPHLTVRDNIGFPLVARRLRGPELRKRVDGVAAGLDIAHLLDRKPKELSGGQQQRVAIGRALIRRPSVYLFDEPLSNLDAKLRVELRAELLRLQREMRTTSIYVTHDQEEAMTLSDLMVVLNEGEIAQQGSPADIYARPTTTFVATFIGNPQINIVGATVQDSVLRAGPFSISVPTLAPGGYTIGIRPEDLRVGAPAHGSATLGQVELVELLGPRAIVTIKTPEDHTLRAVAETAELRDVGEGKTIPIALREENVLVFDQSGKRLELPQVGVSEAASTPP